MTEVELKETLKKYTAGPERNEMANWLWQQNGIVPEVVWDVMVEIESEETA